MVGVDQPVVVLDSGAVIALGRGDQRLRARLRAVTAAGAEVSVPVVVVAEVSRGDGPRDAPVNLVLAQASPVHALGEATARQAGRLLAKARSNSTIDALVAAHALDHQPSVVLTSDPDDLRQLLDGHRSVRIEPV